jgi:hypothetical protein
VSHIVGVDESLTDDSFALASKKVAKPWINSNWLTLSQTVSIVAGFGALEEEAGG